MGMTQGMQIQNALELRRLAEVHGDLQAIAILQERVAYPFLGSNHVANFVTFEGKKKLWNAISRLTSRVNTVILTDSKLRHEIIHLAAKGMKGRNKA